MWIRQKKKKLQCPTLLLPTVLTATAMCLQQKLFLSSVAWSFLLVATKLWFILGHCIALGPLLTPI